MINTEKSIIGLKKIQTKLNLLLSSIDKIKKEKLETQIRDNSDFI
jgi:hypothetical protein